MGSSSCRRCHLDPAGLLTALSPMISMAHLSFHSVNWLHLTRQQEKALYFDRSKHQHIQFSLHMLATVDGWRCGHPIIGCDGQERPALGPAPRGLGDDAVDEERRPVELPLGNGLRQAPRIGGMGAPRTLGLCCVATHPLARGDRLEV